MTNENQRMRILQMIEDGQLTAAEAERKLRELSGAPEIPPPLGVPPDPDPASGPGPDWPTRESPGEKSGLPPEALRWKRFWLIPFFLGAAGVTAGGWLMWLGVRPQGSIFWLLFGLVVFWIGVLVTALSFGSRKSPWVHVRVRTGEKSWPQHIALSLPVPLRPVAWVVRTFGHNIPALKRTGVDEVLTALDDGKGLDQPLYIDVDEGDGERVQVYFG